MNRQRRTTPLRLAALVAASALLLTGCSGGADPAESSASGEEIEYGGTLRVGFGGEDVANYDPQQRPQLFPRTVSRQITDTLTEQDPETGEILPWLAESWEINDDVTEFTFHLKEGVTFSDGTPFDAEIVKANFDRVVEIGSLAFIAGSYFRGYVGSEVVDEHTVTATFDSPNAQFLQATSTQSLGIIGQASIDLAPEEVAAGDVIGTGPFVVESYEPENRLVLAAREDYAWPSPLYENPGRPYYDTVEISFIPDPTTLSGSVTSGQLDYAYILDASTTSTVESSGATLVSTPMPAISIPLVPLLHRDVFAEENVRRALGYATDRQAIVDTVFQGAYTPATGVLTTTNPGYVDLSDELVYDVDVANQILDESSFSTVGDDGIRVNGDGEPLAITIQYTGAGTTETLLQLVQQQWNQVGIDFRLEPVADLSEYSIHDYPFDITTWSQTRADPDVLRIVYSSFYENQSFLFTNPDEELDAALNVLQTTVDADERLEASRAVQEIILERGYSVPLYDLIQYSAAAPGIEGAHTDIEGKPLLVDVHP
ncbi:ABC transporter substrate-binding protein [Microbacterium betulae]|uniref:ABC transporter substrate-binding protein n=1 Tax=Microbacterium betulae TaxID=2981139 RepID=A0AA97I6C3_9MICO|nr:ABC transporter substrate-binding protein [Microbacterium sp. AB]WOF22472.1 ABC transporter substrate-binding protein [Microbacterium sp. AB]